MGRGEPICANVYNLFSMPVVRLIEVDWPIMIGGPANGRYGVRVEPTVDSMDVVDSLGAYAWVVTGCESTDVTFIPFPDRPDTCQFRSIIIVWTCIRNPCTIALREATSSCMRSVSVAREMSCRRSRESSDVESVTIELRSDVRHPSSDVLRSIGATREYANEDIGALSVNAGKYGDIGTSAEDG